jgi:hypothetical protein
MIELLILWNVAALRQEQTNDTDSTVGVVAIWILAQVLIWPVSLFVLIWKFFKLPWLKALVVAVVITTIGFLIGGSTFYFVVGGLFMVAAASAVAHIVLSDA